MLLQTYSVNAQEKRKTGNTRTLYARNEYVESKFIGDIKRNGHSYKNLSFDWKIPHLKCDTAGK